MAAHSARPGAEPVAHGTISGYQYFGCRCDPCKLAASKYRKRQAYKRAHGLGGRRPAQPPAPPRMVPAEGVQRRLAALIATGWTRVQLAGLLGCSTENVNLLVKKAPGDTVRVVTLERVREVYDRAWQGPPPTENRFVAAAQIRARREARRNGWVPPLGWDDDEIDDPAATPYRIRKGDLHSTVASREAVWRLELGESPSEIARDLGVTVEAITRGVARRNARNARREERNVG